MHYKTILIFLALGTTSFSMDSPVEEWPVESGYIPGTNFVQERGFHVPPGMIEPSFEFRIRTGLLKILPSLNQTLHIQLSGDEAALQNMKLGFNLNDHTFVFEDMNEPEETENTAVDRSMNYDSPETQGLIVATNVRSSREKLAKIYKARDVKFNKPYLTRSELLNEFGPNSSIDSLIIGGNCLERVTLGPKGLIVSGLVKRGHVDQKGVKYGAGTFFLEGVAHVPEKPVHTTKPTVVTILLPAACAGLSCHLTASGDARIEGQDLRMRRLYSVALGNSRIQLGSLKLEKVSIASRGHGVQNLTLQASQNIRGLQVYSSEYGEVFVEGQDSVCRGKMVSSAKAPAKVSVSHLTHVSPN